MKKNLLRIMLAISLMTNVLATSGCFILALGAAVGAGGIAYVKGALTQKLDCTIEKVHKAVLKAARDTELFIISDTVNVHNAVLKGEFSEDHEKVMIEIESLTERASQITIRVGVFGDEARSRMILSAITKRL